MNHERIQVKHAHGETIRLEPVVVGEHAVHFSLELVGAIPVRGVRVAATSDTGGRAEGVMAMQSLPHDHHEEKFLNDLRRFAWRVAEEAAGHGQGQTFVDKFFPASGT